MDKAVDSIGNPKVLISLFDHSGQWSAPYKEAGWEVFQVDIKNGIDIMTWDYIEWGKKVYGISKYNNKPLIRAPFVCGILAAVPCTDFALSGAKWFAEKDKTDTTKNSIKLVKKTLEIIHHFGLEHQGYHGGMYDKGDSEFFWVIENPMSRIHSLAPELGKVKYKFNPCDFAGYSKEPETNQYNKQTWLWGLFNEPIKKPLPSLMTGLQWKDSRKSTGEKRRELRSITPDGFSQAFYEVNH
jgi:hypothetical protein